MPRPALDRFVLCPIEPSVTGNPIATIVDVIARRKLEISILAAAVAISRFVFRSRYLYDLDSVNFALGIVRFDPRVHQPHPPGYFLYVCLGRLLTYFVHDPNLALVLLSIAAGMATVIMIYLLALDWFGDRAAVFAGLLFLFSPLAWFYGTVALTYGVECFFSALLGYLCWRIDQGGNRLILPAAILLGISAGIRPSSLLFLGPLFLYALRHAAVKKILLGGAALALTLIAWFLPMIWASGGFDAYFGALLSLWRLVPSRDTVFNSSPVTSMARACIIVFIGFLCFGAAMLAPLGARRDHNPANRGKMFFTAVWIVPALCFFTFIFLKLVNSGYLLLVAAPACIWMGCWAAEWVEHCAWLKSLKLALIGICALANVCIFLFFPAYCSYRSVRRFETNLRGIQAALPQLGDPNQILILGFDSHFLGYRHAGYYLPAYLTLEYPEVKLTEGTRIFSMQGRDTRLLTRLPAGSYSRFVVFPLPTGDAQYQHYLDTFKKLLPARDLVYVNAGGRQFITAPIADLPLLFPHAAALAQ